jgi:hypothetical protein
MYARATDTHPILSAPAGRQNSSERDCTTSVHYWGVRSCKDHRFSSRETALVAYGLQNVGRMTAVTGFGCGTVYSSYRPFLLTTR